MNVKKYINKINSSKPQSDYRMRLQRLQHNELLEFLKAQKKSDNILCSYAWTPEGKAMLEKAGIGRQSIVETKTSDEAYGKMRIACKHTKKKLAENGNGHLVENVTFGISVILTTIDKLGTLPTVMQYVERTNTTTPVLQEKREAALV